ncbi:MAG: GNAT family N-acetyltransferase [Clostridia bacterium]|nr:GNAT family N-acetyltransferase [Clostridia bacterium]
MHRKMTLRSFNKNDLAVLRAHVLAGSSDAEMYSTIDSWNTRCYNGKYFEMFAVCVEEAIIGTISLYQHGDDTISAGPEIFPEYRQKGYASAAMEMALAYAKAQGYKIAVAQIRKNNIASIRLHEKLGFALESETINRHGNEVFVYTKTL